MTKHGYGKRRAWEYSEFDVEGRHGWRRSTAVDEGRSFHGLSALCLPDTTWLRRMEHISLIGYGCHTNCRMTCSRPLRKSPQKYTFAGPPANDSIL